MSKASKRNQDKLNREKQKFSVKFFEKINDDNSQLQFFSELGKKSLLRFLYGAGKKDALSYLNKPSKRVDAYIKVNKPMTNFQKKFMSDGKACQNLLVLYAYETISKISKNFNFSVTKSEISFSATFNEKKHKVNDKEDNSDDLIDFFTTTIIQLINDSELFKATNILAGFIASPKSVSLFTLTEQEEFLVNVSCPSKTYLQSVANKLEGRKSKEKSYPKPKISSLRKDYIKLGETFAHASEKLLNFEELPSEDFTKDIESLKKDFETVQKYIRATGEKRGLKNKKNETHSSLKGLAKFANKIEKYKAQELDQKLREASDLLEKAMLIEVNTSQNEQHLNSFFKIISELQNNISENPKEMEKILSKTHPVSMLVKILQEKEQRRDNIDILQKALVKFCGSDIANFLSFNILMGKLNFIESKGNSDKGAKKSLHRTINENKNVGVSDENKTKREEFENEFNDKGTFEVVDTTEELSKKKLVTNEGGGGDPQETIIEKLDPSILNSNAKALDLNTITSNPLEKEYFEKCIKTGDYRKAYWIAQSCDIKYSSDLIGALAIGTEIGVGSSLPAELQSFFGNLVTDTFDGVSSKILLFSAIIGSTLFTTPSSNELFTLIEYVDSGVKQLEDLTRFIKSEFIYKGSIIRPSDIDSALGHEGKEQQLRALKDKSSELLQRYSNADFTNYTPAKILLRHLYREGSELSMIHRAIERDSFSKRHEIYSLLKKLSGETLIGNAHTLGLNKVVSPITGTARNQLIRRVNDTISIGREWHSLKTEELSENNKHEKEQIINYLQQYLKNAVGSLDSLLQKKVEETVINVVRKSFNAIVDQLDGAEKINIVPLNYEILGMDTLILNDEFEMDSDAESCLMDSFNNHSEFDSEISLNNFESFLRRQEFLRAKQNIDLFELNQDYSDRLEQAVDEEQNRILDRIEELQIKVEDAYLLGRLDLQEDDDKDENSKKTSQEILRSDLIGKLNKVSSQLRSDKVAISWRTRGLESIINTIEIQLDRMGKKHNISLEKEFNKIIAQFSDSETGNEDKNYVESAFKEAIKQDDNIAAFELINRAREAIQEKVPFPKTSIGENKELDAFLKKIDAYQDLLGNKGKIDDYISSMKQRKSVGGINFGTFDQARLNSAVIGLSAWRDLLRLNHQKSQEKIINELKNISGFLDLSFRKKSVLIKSHIDDDFVYLTTKLNFPIDCCPIPTFGSLMGQIVHIVLSKNKKEPDQLSSFLNRHQLQHKPVFLFYLQEMGIRQRRVYQQFCAKKKLSVLLIDLCLAFHLCGIKNPLPALFKIALPFSWAQPYVMKGENVPRETFVGRNEEVKSIHDINGSCIIFGGRQLGKSALLRHIYNTYNNPTKNEYIAYLDIDGLGMDPQSHEQMQGEFWREVHSALCREKCLVEKEISFRKGSKRVGAEVVADILNTLKENPEKHLYLLLDEADYFLDNDSSLHFPIIRQLRGMMATTNRRFKVVLAGLQSVQRYKNWKNHPFAQLGTDLVVRPLNPDAAQKLILTSLRALGFVFEKTGLILRIVSQANYHPGLIQIFCHRLLEKLYIKWGNKLSNEIARTISLDDLLMIERDPNFIEDIRNRFDWTLDLDDRYKVLIYSLVLTEDPTSPRTEREFMSLSRYWWPEVFEKMDQHALRAVLDEMDGLGVLVREDEETTRMYRLRSPNLLRLLGTREQIEDELQRIISLDKPRILNSRNFHSKINNKPVSFGPMTKEQEGQIANESNIFGISIISGSIALGLDCVSNQIKSIFSEMKEWEEIVVPLQLNATPKKIINYIKEELKPRNRLNKYVIIDLTFFHMELNVTDMSTKLLKNLSKQCMKKSRCHIFLLVDPQHSWHWLGESNRESIIQHQRVNSIELKRWSNGAITNALENINILAGAKAFGEDIFDITLGWHKLIDKGIKTLNKNSKKNGKTDIVKIWQDQGEILNKDFAKNSVDILKEFSLFSEEPLLIKCLKNIFDLSSSDPNGSKIISQDIFDYLAEEDKTFSEILSDGGNRIREWLLLNDIVYRTKDGHLLVNQVVQDILMNGVST